MSAVWLTVACELLLGACGLAAAVLAWRRQAWLGAAGCALVGATALLGALRYGGVEAALAPHQALGFAAARLGLPLVALGAVRQPLHLGAVALALLAALLLPPLPAALLLPPLPAQGLSLLALAWIARPGAGARWPLAAGGALLFVLAALVVGTRGQWQGFARMDLYHLAIAAALALWIAAGVPRGNMGEAA